MNGVWRGVLLVLMSALMGLELQAQTIKAYRKHNPNIKYLTAFAHPISTNFSLEARSGIAIYGGR